MRRHQGGKFEHYNISIAIYHKYSHGTAYYRLNGEDANVMFGIMFTASIFRQSVDWNKCKLIQEMNFIFLKFIEAYQKNELHSLIKAQTREWVDS